MTVVRTRNTLDVAAINEELRLLAKADASAACVAWRRWSGAARLDGQPRLQHVADALLNGAVVASIFDPRRATVERVPGGVHVVGQSMMTTAVAQSTWLLVHATAEAGSELVLLPVGAIVRAVRPAFVGLAGADNALVDVDTVVDEDHVLVGDANELVDRPYALGLTVGSIAVGAAQAALDLLCPMNEDGTDATAQELVGNVAAQIAAADALVRETSRRSPCATWWSKAAKVAATASAEAACALVRRELGAPTYGANHPLNQIEADVRGLVHQAPSGPGAARWIATHDAH